MIKILRVYTSEVMVNSFAGQCHLNFIFVHLAAASRQLCLKELHSRLDHTCHNFTAIVFRPLTIQRIAHAYAFYTGNLSTFIS